MRVTDVQRQLACSQKIFCLKYFISIHGIPTTPRPLYGSGTYLCTYVKYGDKSYSHHHTVSISKFSAHTKLLSGRISVSGQPFLLLLIIAIPGEALGQKEKATSLLHSSTPVV